MPTSCIECNGAIHRKSEHYCSKHCENVYKTPTDEKKPPFLSKWKVRKLKEAKDPLIKERQKVRRKTNDLIKEGKLRKKACVVCGKKTVLPHHEDYSNPFKVIWLCEEDHLHIHIDSPPDYSADEIVNKIIINSEMEILKVFPEYQKNAKNIFVRNYFIETVG